MTERFISKRFKGNRFTVARLSVATLTATLAALNPFAVLAAEPGNTQTPAIHPAIHIETVAQNLASPWSIAFLPDGDFLVTELVGNLRRISADGTVHPPIQNVPDVYFAGQGGLFDVLLAPDFATSGVLFLSYAAGPDSNNATTVARATLSQNAQGQETLQDLTVIFSASPRKPTSVHYGGRMAWMPDQTLLLTTGDGFDYREHAQDLTTHFGKTIRMTTSGDPIAAPPFPEHPYVWTYGHRNPQGLAITQGGAVYLHEHGPQGGDEINLLQAGQNYGWPAITYGLDYNGAYVSPLTEYQGMEQPEYVWTPSIAPSGLMVYEGDLFPQWQGHLFIGALVDEEIRQVDLHTSGQPSERVAFKEIKQRIRDIRMAPDGSIFVLTDGDGGSVLRVVPAR